MLRYTLLLVSFAFLAACDSAAPHHSEPSSTALARGGPDHVNVCHGAGDGYDLITVAAPAVEAHRRHGDAIPGEDVPGQDGFAFDDTCRPVRKAIAALTCPAELAVGEAGTFTGAVNADAGGLDEGAIAYAFDLDGDTSDDDAGVLSEPDVSTSFTFGAAGTYTASFTVSGPVNADSATCTVTVTASETVFAIAYTDVDPDDGDRFADGVDVLIAKLVDANGDGAPGEGDEVVTSRYPTTTHAAVFADFTVTRHAVSRVVWGSFDQGTTVRVFGTGAPTPVFDFRSREEAAGGEIYSESSGADRITATFLRDAINNAVSTGELSPSRPSVAALSVDSREGRGDQPFLDVVVDPAGL